MFAGDRFTKISTVASGQENINELVSVAKFS